MTFDSMAIPAGLAIPALGGVVPVLPAGAFFASPAAPPAAPVAAATQGTLAGGAPPGGIDLGAMATQYVTQFLATPKPVVPDRTFMRRDANRTWLADFRSRNLEQYKPLYEAAGNSEGTMRLAVDAALSVSDTHDAGMCMGFLNPDYDCPVGSEAFREGLRLGQVHYLKLLPPRENRFRKYGIIALAVGIAMMSHGIGNRYLTPAQRVIVESALPVLGVVGASWVYGVAAMLATRLFGNDLSPSPRLITSGPFAYHRNPYYASMGFGMALSVGSMIALNLFSIAPSFVGAALTAAGLATLFAVQHVKVKRDERVLERQFGDEYRAYKEDTPRYFPSFRKIFARLFGRSRRT
jgi:protein-S-isoprenylcysteine O-methyltransferase Ste14